MRFDPYVFEKFKPTAEQVRHIETTDLPLLSQTDPLYVKDLHEAFLTDPEKALLQYSGKRFAVTGIVIKIGPDVHNKPSVELSDAADGECHALCIFQNEDFYSQVSVGDIVTLRANYLVFHETYGLVMKKSDLISAEKPHAVPYSGIHYFPAHPSDARTHEIETMDSPLLPQAEPVEAADLHRALCDDLYGTLKIYKDKRFDVTGIAAQVAPGGKSSIYLSDRTGGECKVLCIFPDLSFCNKVKEGDRVTIRANYLVMTDLLGVVMKKSELR